jgi:hypothetical protein
MQKFLGALAVLTLTIAAMSPAGAIELHTMTYHDVDKWVAMPAKQLRATLANKTIRLDVTSRAVGDLNPVLGTGPLILFTAPGGKLLWWTAKSKTVQTGHWSSNTLIEGWELPCFKFDFRGGQTDCYFGGAANYKEWTEGNPFGLQAGTELKAGRASLRDLAKKSGL